MSKEPRKVNLDIVAYNYYCVSECQTSSTIAKVLHLYSGWGLTHHQVLNVHFEVLTGITIQKKYVLKTKRSSIYYVSLLDIEN